MAVHTETEFIQSNRFNYGSIADRASDGSWSVKCCRCRVGMGTMNSDGIMQAIHSTAQRGGVLCPECRANSCEACGTEKTAEQPCFGCMPDEEWILNKSDLLAADEVPF